MRKIDKLFMNKKMLRFEVRYAVSAFARKESCGIANLLCIRFLHIVDEAVDVILVHERNAASTKACTGHACAKTAFLSLCNFCERVQFYTRHFIIIAQRGM